MCGCVLGCMYFRTEGCGWKESEVVISRFCCCSCIGKLRGKTSDVQSVIVWCLICGCFQLSVADADVTLSEATKTGATVESIYYAVSAQLDLGKTGEGWWCIVVMCRWESSCECTVVWKVSLGWRGC